MSLQIIKQNGNPEWAVIPYEVYLQLIKQAEMLEDVQNFDKYKADSANGAEESNPSEVLYAIMDGTNPIRAFREFRGMTQHNLTEGAGITVPYLSQLENGKRKGSLEVMVRVAKTLDVDLEMLVSQKIFLTTNHTNHTKKRKRMSLRQAKRVQGSGTSR